MRKKAIVIGLISLLLSLIVSNIILTAQFLKLKSDAGAAINEVFRQLAEHLHYVDLRVEDIKTDVQILSDNQSQNASEFLRDLASIRKSTDAQFTETISMKETYDGILGELRKKTLDTTAQDAAMLQAKKDAEKYYSENNFASAYREFKKVLSYQYDDMECRLKKLKSLYYMNRADSSKYPEILGDINILKNAGYADEETGEIEELIKAELEGVNES